MPVSKVQLVGGNFQDAEGNVLALGYLKMRLNQDSVVNSSQICSGVEITINLDNSGGVNVSPVQAVWGNDQLSPANSFYRVTGYKSNGQPAFGPNNQQVIGSGGTFDVGTWVPNLVVSWTPPLQPLILQTNEVANGDQLILDLHAGTGISLADNGLGRVTITSTVAGPTFKTNGTSNGSQSILNLKNGTGITVSDDGVGGVTITSGSVLPLGTAHTGDTLRFNINGSGGWNNVSPSLGSGAPGRRSRPGRRR